MQQEDDHEDLVPPSPPKCFKVREDPTRGPTPPRIKLGGHLFHRDLLPVVEEEEEEEEEQPSDPEEDFRK